MIATSRGIETRGYCSMMFAAQKPQIVAPSSTHEYDYEHMSIPAWSSMLSLKRGDDDISTHDRPRSPIIVLGCSSYLLGPGPKRSLLTRFGGLMVARGERWMLIAERRIRC